MESLKFEGRKKKKRATLRLTPVVGKAGNLLEREFDSESQTTPAKAGTLSRPVRA